MSISLESTENVPQLGSLEVRSASLSEQAYNRLREFILDRKITAGSTLLEGKIAEELGISRTPMREALGRLSGEGLLVRRDARSYSVRSIDTKEYFDSMRTRELLECEAVELAVGRVSKADLDKLDAEVESLNTTTKTESEYWRFDDHFHSSIARASGNLVLPRLIQLLRDESRLFRLNSPLHRATENHDEHLEIIRALRRDDAKGARRAMLAHLRSLQNDVKRSVMGTIS